MSQQEEKGGYSAPKCGNPNCCGGAKQETERLVRTPVKTENGEAFVVSCAPKDIFHLQKLIDDAARIEIDGLGKVVKNENPMADKAERSYQTITAKKSSIWSRVVGFINRLTRIRSKPIPAERKSPYPAETEKHLIKRA